MRTRSRSRPAAAAATLLVLVACSDETGPDPKLQFEELVALLQGGQIVRLYQTALPESYREDLDSVLRELPQLLEEKDYDRGREIVLRLGKQVASLIATTPLGEEDAWRALAERLSDSPALVGLATWQDFRDLRAERILWALEDGTAQKLLETSALRGSLKNISVELVNRKRDWARLRLTATPEDGPPRSERFDVVRVGACWVRDEWVVDWPQVMESGRQTIAMLLELKARDPETYRAELDAALDAASRPGFLIEEVLPRLGQQLLGGGSDAGREPGPGQSGPGQSGP